MNEGNQSTLYDHEMFYKNLNNNENTTNTSKICNRLVLLIEIGKCIRFNGLKKEPIPVLFFL